MNNNTLWVLLRFVALLGIVNFMASCTSPKLDDESKFLKTSSLTVVILGSLPSCRSMLRPMMSIP